MGRGDGRQELHEHPPAHGFLAMGAQPLEVECDIDELGYVSFYKQGNEILFNLLSNRNEAGSMIITTNLAFEDWGEVFHDTNLTGALVDRLTYKAHVLDMSGESYRLKETKQLLGK